jgi:hypothetical protein
MNWNRHGSPQVARIDQNVMAPGGAIDYKPRLQQHANDVSATDGRETSSAHN